MAEIVVIEDEDLIRINVARLLSLEGHTIREAADGVAGLAAIREHRPDLVLCDVMMPHLDGHGVLAALQGDPETAGIPFVFLTARADKSDIRQGMSLGADDYLTKPFSRAELMDTVELRLRKATLRRREADESSRQIQQQMELAHEVLERGFARRLPDIPGLRALWRPVERTGGDILLAAHRPDGSLLMLLGDATGHGLSAAIATLPVAETFDRLVKEGTDCCMLLAELNRVLHHRLPRGLFFAACLVEVPLADGQIIVWNGGLPDALILGEDGVRRAPSGNLPLGVSLEEPAAWSFDLMEVKAGDRLYIHSDGIVETSGLGGPLGEEGLLAFLAEHGQADDLPDRLDRHLAEFRVGPQRDDITLAELRFPTRRNAP